MGMGRGTRDTAGTWECGVRSGNEGDAKGGKDGNQIRRSGSCEKPSSYLTLEHYYCILKHVGSYLNIQRKLFFVFYKMEKKGSHR